ncbi:putative Mastigoneme [Globisporangium polare]
MRKWCLWAMAMVLLVASALGACPNKCSGHGRCGINDVCDCMQNWIGGDCSMRLCPLVRAWQDTAVGDNDAHYYKECGARGTCDREKGVCDCDVGFTGSGCRRMVCPDDCSGHGVCDFIEELAQNSFNKRIGGNRATKYTLWDQEKIMGCTCDPGYQGHNCVKRTCPKGDDQLTPNQVEMVQAVILQTSTAAAAASAEMYLTYFDPYGNAFTTAAFTIDTSYAALNPVVDPCANMQTALNRLPNNVLNKVTVQSMTSVWPFVRDSPPATSTTGAVNAAIAIAATANSPKIICLVKFRSEPGTTGYQNLLGCNVNPHNTVGQQPNSAGLSTGTCVVTEVHQTATAVAVSPLSTLALSELSECSGRGLCDYTTGTCKCFTGHMGLGCERQEALV